MLVRSSPGTVSGTDPGTVLGACAAHAPYVPSEIRDARCRPVQARGSCGDRQRPPQDAPPAAAPGAYNATACATGTPTHYHRPLLKWDRQIRRRPECRAF